MEHSLGVSAEEALLVSAKEGTGVDEVFDNYTVGQDGTAFSLPAGTDEILKTSKGL